jgi:hypothetical protein
VFLALQDKDPNLWWRMSSGHGQNIAEEAIDLCEELTNENKSIKSTLTDLIAELRDTAGVYPGATGRLLRDIAGSAEARLAAQE